MRPITLLLAVLAVTSFTSVAAQEPPPIKVGAPVRVTALNLGLNNHTGRLTGVDRDTLAVDTPTTTSISCGARLSFHVRSAR